MANVIHNALNKHKNSPIPRESPKPYCLLNIPIVKGQRIFAQYIEDSITLNTLLLSCGDETSAAYANVAIIKLFLPPLSPDSNDPTIIHA